MTYAIETEGLTRRFGRTEAVKGLTFQVPAGSVFALLGPNGAGKTTTLKLLMNLLRPTQGIATVLGTDTRHLDAAHFQRIGYVSENQRLPEWMTPGELFDYCRPFYPTWDDGLRRRLESDLALSASTSLRTLSRGTRMKAALLASLAYRPDLVVLDEPFTGLDPVVRDELIRGLLDVSGDRPFASCVKDFSADEGWRDCAVECEWIDLVASGFGRGLLPCRRPGCAVLAGAGGPSRTASSGQNDHRVGLLRRARRRIHSHERDRRTGRRGHDRCPALGARHRHPSGPLRGRRQYRAGRSLGDRPSDPIPGLAAR